MWLLVLATSGWILQTRWQLEVDVDVSWRPDAVTAALNLSSLTLWTPSHLHTVPDMSTPATAAVLVSDVTFLSVRLYVPTSIPVANASTAGVHTLWCALLLRTADMDTVTKRRVTIRPTCANVAPPAASDPAADAAAGVYFGRTEVLLSSLAPGTYTLLSMLATVSSSLSEATAVLTDAALAAVETAVSVRMTESTFGFHPVPVHVGVAGLPRSAFPTHPDDRVTLFYQQLVSPALARLRNVAPLCIVDGGDVPAAVKAAQCAWLLS